MARRSSPYVVKGPDTAVEPTRIYSADQAKEFLAGNDDAEKIAQMADGKFMSAFVRARKPA